MISKTSSLNIMQGNPLRRLLKYLLIFCLFFTAAIAAAKSPIAADKAFQFSVDARNPAYLTLKWKIEPGYYLYKSRFSFKVLSPAEATLGAVEMPKGIEKMDDILGKHFVYEKQLSLKLPFNNPTQKLLEVQVSYQGCAEWGFCYPPIAKNITFPTNIEPTPANVKITNADALWHVVSKDAAQTAQPEKVQFHSEQSHAQNILARQSTLMALTLFFGFGLLLAFTPCVLPMIPILSGIIVGQGKKLHTRHAFGLSLSYVLGMAFAFALAGLVVGYLGSNIQAALQSPWILGLFTFIFVLLALSLFGFFDLRLPQRFQQRINDLSQEQKKGSYVGVAVMGALSTLIVSPCVSAPLVGALAYIGQTGNALFGFFALLFMGLGMGLPLLIIGTSFGKLLPKTGHWMNAVKNLFGVLMLGVAIWMLGRVIPAEIYMILWALLAITSAIYMGALSPVQDNGFMKLFKGLGLALLIYGILLLAGAAMGNQDLLQPLKVSYPLQSQQTLSAHSKFTPVKTIKDVETQLAQHQGQPVILDFYADWCVACKEMEKNTFQNPQVADYMKQFVLLQADVTANDAEDKALEKKFGVIAPPTIIFFDKQGREISSARIVGEMGPQAFLSHLRKVNALDHR